jgi:peptidoglycan/xylan/chitin deacetylase (PgdA/CDA1 family)
MGTFKAIASTKRLARRWAAEVYARSPGFLRCLQGKVVILTYHRVVSEEELQTYCIQDGMYVSVETFTSQMRFLKTHFAVISFTELLTMWAQKRWDSTRRYCVVTFDDGWLDNYTHALPVLKSFDVPATVFLPTSFIGTDEWFWPDKVGLLYRRFCRRPVGEQRRIVFSLRNQYAWVQGGERDLLHRDSDAVVEWCKTLVPSQIDAFVSAWAAALEVTLPSDRQVVNWEEVRVMSDAGMSFGSHSVTHRILTKVHCDDVMREAVDSWSALRQQPIRSVPVFCYPNGNWSEEIGQYVKAAGYQAATTTQFGYETQTPSNLFGLRRVHVHDEISRNDGLFAFHLAGYNNIKDR